MLQPRSRNLTETDAEGYRAKGGERLILDWIVDSSDIRDQRDVVVQAFQADARKAGIGINIEQLDSNSYGDSFGSGKQSKNNEDRESAGRRGRGARHEWHQRARRHRARANRHWEDCCSRLRSQTREPLSSKKRSGH